MRSQFYAGMFIGFYVAIILLIIAREHRQMKSDIGWCKVYVNNHLEQEAKRERYEYERDKKQHEPANEL